MLSLPNPVREALAKAKNGSLKTKGRFENREHALPEPQQGYEYIEYDAGQAHPGDPQDRGSWRLVLEVHKVTRRLGEMFFTDKHYTGTNRSTSGPFFYLIVPRQGGVVPR